MKTTLLPTNKKQSTFTLVEPSTALYSLIIRYLLPQMLNDLGIDAGKTSNAYLLSHLSPQEDAEAAATIISTTQILIVVVPSAFLYLLPVAAKQENKAAVITSGVLFALGLSSVGIIIGLSTGTIARQLGASDAVCDLVDDYFQIFSIALPCAMVATALSKLATPLGHKQLLYVESLINGVLLTGFSWLFTRHYPLPNVSPIKTIALSHLVCSAGRILYYTAAYAHFNELEQWQDMNINRYIQVISLLFKISWQLCLQLSSELIALYLIPMLTVFLLDNHKTNLDVLNVMIQCFIFSIIINLSMAITAMNLTKKFHGIQKDEGRQQSHLVRPCVNRILLMSLLYNSALFALVMAKTDTIVSLFMKPNKNTNTGLSGNFQLLFLISYFGLVFTAFKDIINMSQRALGIYSLPMKVSLGGIWGLGLPLGALLAKTTDLGIGGLWLGYNIGNTLTGAFLLGHWHLTSQTDIVEAIFSGNTDIPTKVDQVTYCLTEYKNALFPSFSTDKTARQTLDLN